MEKTILWQKNSNLETMVMCLFSIMGTLSKPLEAIIHGTETQESVLERLFALTMPLVVSNHFLFFDKHLETAVNAVVVFPVAQVFTVLTPTLCTIVVPETRKRKTIQSYCK